jgi:hypothetical protein
MAIQPASLVSSWVMESTMRNAGMSCFTNNHEVSASGTTPTSAVSAPSDPTIKKPPGLAARAAFWCGN